MPAEKPIVKVEPNEWMIRPCHIYNEEYSDCTSIKAKLHQYFIFGETLDCSQWKEDYKNCVRWKEHKDFKARVTLLESEEARRKARLDAHYNNTVWEKRLEPPADWSKPLPEWMQKDYANSYLEIKSKEIEENKINDNYANRTFCVIM